MTTARSTSERDADSRGRQGMRRVRRRDARLVPVAATAWIAAGVAVWHADTAGVIACAAWTTAALALVAALRRAHPARTRWALCAVALAIGAAVCTHVAAAQPVRGRAADLEITGGRSLTLEVRAVGKIEPSAVGWRFEATAHRVQRGQDRSGAVSFGGGVPVVVRLDDAPAGLDLGARVRLTGVAWPASRGQRAVLVVDVSGELDVLDPPWGPLAVASELRHGLNALTRSLPPPGGGLIAGLAVGDTSGVGTELDAAMKASSLSHLTAVSGANCALVVAAAFGAAALCRARRGLRVAAGLAALAAFVLLVSPEPSVVRAAAMAAVAMLGILLGRPGAGLSLLSAAIIVLLLVDPWLALSLGFALSAAATGALLVIAGPLADGLTRWMPRTVALGIAVPLAAQLACGPLIVLISPQLSVYGVVANIIAAPAAPLGTVVGLAACLTAGVPWLGSGLAAIAWLPASWIAGTARTFAALPGSVVYWPEGLWGLLALALIGIAVAGVIAPAPARVRVVSAWILAGALGAGLAFGPIADLTRRAAIPGAWSIAACDVGQGDAVLVRSAGAVALIDTGPDPALLTRCLEELAVDRLDLLVLTHFDMDHRGGLAAVRGRVATVLHGPTDDGESVRVLADLAQSGAHLLRATRGMSGELGAARWNVLWPRTATPPGNDASVVLEVLGGGVPASVYLGDLSAAAQQAMAAQGALRSAYQVVKIAHHGSADQDSALYARLRPALALVTVGENDYGHPRAEILDLLASLGARVARTDREGLITVWTDAAGLRLWHERAPGAVAPDG